MFITTHFSSSLHFHQEDADITWEKQIVDHTASNYGAPQDRFLFLITCYCNNRQNESDLFFALGSQSATCLMDSLD